MKKMIFLMLLLITLGAASMNAQVAIGAGTGVDNGPHSGAVLELDGSKGGLLLPKVSITDAGIFQLVGSEEDGIGMLVYNTNETITGGYGIGVYVWDGENWNIVNRQGGFDNEFNPDDYGTGLPSGLTSVSLSGVTCFDVTTDIGPSSGYSFAIAPTSITVKSVVWNIADPYKVLRDPNPSSSGTAGATLYFKSYTAIGDIIDEHPSDNVAVTLTALVTFSNDGTMKLSKTAKFQKESCCVAGMSITNGVWTGQETTTSFAGGSNAATVQGYFNQQIGSSLCLASTDEGNNINWFNASITCDNSTKDDQPAGSWRLPNIAEISQTQDTAPNYGMRAVTYWSSTMQNGGNSWRWAYPAGVAYPSPNDFTFDGLNVRCVRSL